MSSQAGSPPAPSGDSSLQLPPQPKKRARKEGGAAGGTSKGKGKGKAARLEGADGGDGQDGQQQRRQSLAPQSGGDGSLSRSQGASGSNAAAGPSNSNNNADERPAKKGEKRGQQKLSRKNLFAKDLPSLMYAFGDDPNPLPESVNVLEEILVDYVSELCKSAAAHSPNAKKVRLDDLRFALRRPQQSKQLARLEELLYLQEDIARARKLDFDGIS
ncbi:TFIID-18kDa-domain-containing protein [Cystobasidium minutum MCA 4210]|uniref:TFIID-18kDa-domain-containing protein n=1 Tax=Cystobasidium minutum MCA 4210 TaxID=1397322 RepID=UPI0034CE9542|eukprot:jgi/Rhomi1/197691/gm1.5905_g